MSLHMVTMVVPDTWAPVVDMMKKQGMTRRGTVVG